MNAFQRLATLTLSVVVAACGGTDEAPIQKYAGLWTQCVAHASGSTLSTWTIEPVTDLRAELLMKVQSFDTTTCSGNGSPPMSTVASVEWVGVTSLPNEPTVDKVHFAVGSLTRKEIFRIADGFLKTTMPPPLITGIGGESANRDAEGFPVPPITDYLLLRRPS
jgi:hypothetical protein